MLSDSESDGHQLTINEHYAQAFAYRKEREELERLKDKYGSEGEEESESESESETEDEDGQELTPAVDVAILRVLSKIKNKDPGIYEAEKGIFEEEAKRTVDTIKKKSANRKSKPITIKQQAIAEILDRSPSPILPTHVEEQEALRSETISVFHQAVQSDGDALFTLREKTKDEQEREEEEYRSFLQREVGEDIAGLVTVDKSPEIAEKKKKAKETDQEFLLNYILNRGWIDRTTGHVPTYSEVTDLRDGIEDEEEFDDVVDHFESSYNFRFEEPGAAVIATHPRNLPSLVRRPDTARKEAREKRKKRKEEEKMRMREEVQRLKALKMREIRKKLDKISREGGDAAGLEDLDLEGDWDPDKHDQQMEGIYGDDQQFEDIDTEKPVWDNDIDISDLVGESLVTKKKKKKKSKEVDEVGVDVEDMDAEVDGTRKRKLDEYMDEVYGLEFNDMVGNMPTRFSYTSVPSQSFTLTPAEILLATDAELNEYMGVGKYAPYRKDGGWDKGRAERLRAFKEKLKQRKWGDDNEEEITGEERKPKKRKGKKERQRERDTTL